MPAWEAEFQVCASDPAEPSRKTGLCQLPLPKVTKVRHAERATEWQSSDCAPVSEATSPFGRQVSVQEAV